MHPVLEVSTYQDVARIRHADRCRMDGRLTRENVIRTLANNKTNSTTTKAHSIKTTSSKKNKIKLLQTRPEPKALKTKNFSQASDSTSHEDLSEDPTHPPASTTPASIPSTHYLTRVTNQALIKSRQVDYFMRFHKVKNGRWGNEKKYAKSGLPESELPRATGSEVGPGRYEQIMAIPYYYKGGLSEFVEGHEGIAREDEKLHKALDTLSPLNTKINPIYDLPKGAARPIIPSSPTIPIDRAPRLNINSIPHKSSVGPGKYNIDNEDIANRQEKMLELKYRRAQIRNTHHSTHPANPSNGVPLAVQGSGYIPLYMME